MRRARRDHADNATRGPGQYRVLAAEGARLGKAAVRLHEMQIGRRRKASRHPLDVAPQDRRQIGIDDRGVAAADELDQGRHFVADGNLRESKLAGELREALLMRRVAPPVHQHDRERIDPAFAKRGERLARLDFVERHQDVAVDPDPLVDFDDALVEHRGKHDVASEDVGPGLISDPQRITEAAGDRQCASLALPFEQGVGGDGRAHSYLGDASPFVAKDALDRFERGVVILRRDFPTAAFRPAAARPKSARRHR